MPSSGSSTSPVPVMMNDAAAIGDGEHRFEAPQDAIGAPVLRELDCRAREVALMLLELRFEALE